MALIGRWRGRSLLAPPLLPRLQLLWVLLLSQEFSFRPSGRQGHTHSPWHDKVGNKKELNPDGQDDGRVDRQGFTLFLSPILSFPLLLSFFPFMCHFFPLLPFLLPNSPTSVSSHPFLYFLFYIFFFPFLIFFLPSSHSDSLSSLPSFLL